jgi:hypothetical protein
MSQDGHRLRISNALPGLRPLQLIRAWKECAGPALLQQVKFLGTAREEDGFCLRLEVPDPLWRQELEFQKDSILAAFNAKLASFGYPVMERPVRCKILNAGAPGPATRNGKAAKRRG